MRKGWQKMARTEKDFLNTLETYIKVTKDRLKDGRIIDAYDELSVMQTMVAQRIAEVEGKAVWVTMDPRVTDLDAIAEESRKVWDKAQPTLEALKEHPWKSDYSLEELIERQAEGEDEIEKGIEEAEQRYVWDHYYDGKKPEKDYGAEMLKALTRREE